MDEKLENGESADKEVKPSEEKADKEVKPKKVKPKKKKLKRDIEMTNGSVTIFRAIEELESEKKRGFREV